MRERCVRAAVVAVEYPRDEITAAGLATALSGSTTAHLAASRQACREVGATSAVTFTRVEHGQKVAGYEITLSPR